MPCANAEMYRTHGVGVDECGCHERTRAQYDVNAATASMNVRIEAGALHRLDDERDRIFFGGRTELLTSAGATPDFNRRVARSKHFAEEQTETLVRPGGAPPAICGGMGAVVESRPSASSARRLFFDHEIRVDQLRQVLSDRVVIEGEVRRELGDIDRRARVGHVAKDRVASRVAERSRLLLQRRNRRLLRLHQSSPRHVGHLFFYSTLEKPVNVPVGRFSRRCQSWRACGET